MAINIHWHRFPGCGTTHNTACSAVAGRMANCIQASQGPHQGEWGCIHVTGESISLKEFADTVEKLLCDFTGKDLEQSKKEK